MPTSLLRAGSTTRIQRETVEGQVYELLRDAILERRIPSGQKLTQNDVAEQLGTSRIPVRDALKRLENDGLVEPDARGTYRALHFGPEDIAEIYGLRMLLEPYAAVAAVDRITEADILTLRRILEGLEEAAKGEDSERYVELNRAFHMTIYELSRMPRLVRIIRGLWSGRPLFNPMEITGRFEDSIRDHVTLVDALEARDRTAVRLRLEVHITQSGALLQRRLADRAASDAEG